MFSFACRPCFACGGFGGLFPESSFFMYVPCCVAVFLKLAFGRILANLVTCNQASWRLSFLVCVVLLFDFSRGAAWGFGSRFRFPVRMLSSVPWGCPSLFHNRNEVPRCCLHIQNDKLCFPHAKPVPSPLVSFVGEARCIRKESLGGQDSLYRFVY